MKSISITFIILFSVFLSMGQEVEKKPEPIHDFGEHHTWVTLSYGSATSKKGNRNYYSVGAAGTYLYKNKYAVRAQFYGLDGLINREHTLDKLETTAILLGINKSYPKVHSLLLFAGPSFGKGTLYGKVIPKPTGNSLNSITIFGNDNEYEEAQFKYNGFYMSGEYLFRGTIFGFGFQYYVNIHQYTDHGINVTLNLGVLNNERR
ncbi:MAG: hypothetical protein ACR2GN_02180 [Bacteroidia bacterium]